MLLYSQVKGNKINQKTVKEKQNNGKENKLKKTREERKIKWRNKRNGKLQSNICSIRRIWDVSN